MSNHLFPSGMAEGGAFCNRVLERKELAGNLLHGNPTVLSAPRRYGKSSLIKKVVTDAKLPYAWIDFLTVSTKEEVQEQIAKLVAQAIYAISPDLGKIQLQVAKIFKGLGTEIKLGMNLGKTVSSSISLHPHFQENLQIDEILMKLDELATQVKKRVVFVFDEFQQIALLKESSVIEGMIRHAVERSRMVSYVFSGSNRHLLSSMFSSKDRPLYRLCLTMPIERIAEQEYQTFLKPLAKKKWGSELADATFSKIMALSEKHPFYVNAICNKLWKDHTHLPDAKDIEKTWDWFVLSNKNTFISEVIDLSANQKRIINCLAETPVPEVRGKEFLLMTKLPPSSIVQAMDALESKDLIFKDDQGLYRLLDPAVRYYILKTRSGAGQ